MSSKNAELAKKIVTKKALITKGEIEYDFDLINVIGRRFQVPLHKPGKKKDSFVTVTKAEAIEDAAAIIAAELDSGDLQLSSTWAKDNKLA